MAKSSNSHVLNCVHVSQINFPNKVDKRSVTDLLYLSS